MCYSYADATFAIIPLLLFSSKFTRLINWLYTVNMVDWCLVHCVLYSQLQIVNMTVKKKKNPINRLYSYQYEWSLTAKCILGVSVQHTSQLFRLLDTKSVQEEVFIWPIFLFVFSHLVLWSVKITIFCQSVLMRDCH